MIKKQPSTKLLWIGTGDLKEKVISLSKDFNILDKIIFVDESSVVDEYYCAMDLFLLPSAFEGLGIVFVEAQASGLKTYASTNVPKDVEVSELIEFIETKDEKNWAEKIISCNKDYERSKYNETIKNSIFFKDETKNELLEYYNIVMKGE